MATKQKLIPPDFTATCGYYGGHIKSAPRPLVRMFGDHSPRRRSVKVNVTSWVGTSAIGAKHVYVVLEVESNPVWNPIHGRWQEYWDDKEKDWKSWEDREKLRTEFIYKNGYDVKITNWVKRTVKKFFPADKYEIFEEYKSIEPTTWVYKVEGD